MGSKRSFLNVILSKSRQSVGSMKIDCDSDGMKASAYSDTGCQTLVMELPVTTGTCEGNPDPDPGMPGFIKASCPTSGTTKVLNGGSTTAGPTSGPTCNRSPDSTVRGLVKDACPRVFKTELWFNERNRCGTNPSLIGKSSSLSSSLFFHAKGNEASDQGIETHCSLFSPKSETTKEPHQCVTGCRVLGTWGQGRFTCSGVSANPPATPGYVSIALHSDNSCSTSSWSDTVEYRSGLCVTSEDLADSLTLKRRLSDLTMSQSRETVAGSFRMDCNSDGIVKVSSYKDKTACKDLIREVQLSSGTCNPRYLSFVRASCPTWGTTKPLFEGSPTDPDGSEEEPHILIIILAIMFVLGLGIGAGVVAFIRRRTLSNPAIDMVNINAAERTVDNESTNDAEEADLIR